MQDREASEGVVVAPRIGGGHMRTKDIMRATYPFLFKDEGTWFCRLVIK